MNVRIVSSADPATLRERFGAALAGADAGRLAAAAEALVLSTGPLRESQLELLRAGGIVVAVAGATTLIATSRAALAWLAAVAVEADRPLVAALVAAFDRAALPSASLRMRDRVLDLRTRAAVMGIVNVTPDSFYEHVDGVEAAVAAARAFGVDGAAIVDVGGRSYAASSAIVSAEEEAARVVPAIRALRAARIAPALSVDTVHGTVADAALDAGAHAINDCSGLGDPALVEAVARHDAGLVVMHLKGRLNVREPQTYRYGDALTEIVDFLYERTERAVAAGVARDAIAVDPGLEFGKEPETDLEILARFAELRSLGYPIVLASSRKSFIGRVLGRPAQDLLAPSLASAAVGVAAGARIVRAHDVAETVLLCRMLTAIGNHAAAAPV